MIDRSLLPAFAAAVASPERKGPAEQGGVKPRLQRPALDDESHTLPGQAPRQDLVEAVNDGVATAHCGAKVPGVAHAGRRGHLAGNLLDTLAVSRKEWTANGAIMPPR